jgi:hypothetical protein
MKTNRYRMSLLLVSFAGANVVIVHILSGDLIMHKRTLEPIKTLIYGLRRYDVDRCTALVDLSKEPPGTKVEGFMSHKSKIYLVSRFQFIDRESKGMLTFGLLRRTCLIIWNIFSLAWICSRA